MPIIQPKIQQIWGEKLAGAEIPGYTFSKCKPAIWVEWKVSPTLSLRRSHLQRGEVNVSIGVQITPYYLLNILLNI